MSLALNSLPKSGEIIALEDAERSPANTPALCTVYCTAGRKSFAARAEAARK